MKKRDVSRFGAPDHLRSDLKHQRRARGCGVARKPRAERLPIPPLGRFTSPGLGRINRTGHPLKAQLRLGDVGKDRWIDARNCSLVANRLAVPVDQVVTFVIGGVTLQAELVRERVDLELRWPNPLATYLGCLTADRQRFVEESSAYAIARFTNDY